MGTVSSSNLTSGVIIGKFRGVAVRAHWTILLLIPAALFLNNFTFLAALTLLFVIFIHEVGHLVFARWAGCEVHEIRITIYGGQCIWSGRTGVFRGLLIYWGGIFAQLLLLSLCVAITLTFPEYRWLYLRSEWTVLTLFNLLIIIFNLIPQEPLDGKHAWKIFPYLFDLVRATSQRKKMDRQMKSTVSEKSDRNKYLH